MKTAILYPPGRLRTNRLVAAALGRLNELITFTERTPDRTLRHWWDSDIDALLLLAPHTPDELAAQTERLQRLGITGFVHLQPVSMPLPAPRSLFHLRHS